MASQHGRHQAFAGNFILQISATLGVLPLNLLLALPHLHPLYQCHQLPSTAFYEPGHLGRLYCLPYSGEPICHCTLWISEIFLNSSGNCPHPHSQGHDYSSGSHLILPGMFHNLLSGLAASNPISAQGHCDASKCRHFTPLLRELFCGTSLS